jgi:tripartite-type tricarboxylate transporter receptor subunit TctC
LLELASAAVAPERRDAMTRKIGLAVATSLALSALHAHAQSWPARRIDMIIAFSAGGSTDVIGRSVATALSELLGQQVVVNNRDGASGTIGFGALASAPADGYTIGFGPTTPIANAPYLVKGVRYQVDSFEYICQVFENPFTIAVAPDSRFKSAQELIAAAKESPGKVSYGHPGSGTIPHLAVANLADALKLQFHGVPFRGEGPMLPILIKGDVDFGTVAVVSLRGQTLRPLLVFAAQRHPALPDVPTDRELGVPTSVPPGHQGLFTPKGLPPEIRASLERACTTAITHDIVHRTIDNAGLSITYLTGAEFLAQTVADYKFKGELIRRLGLAAQ